MAFETHFIEGASVRLPLPGPRLANRLYNDGNPVEHTYHSILFHTERGFAACAAHNHDASTRSVLSNDNERPRSFDEDPQVNPPSIQINNRRGYHGDHNPWDRGHLCQREMMNWGDPDLAASAMLESDYWTNIVPQHETLHHSAWGKIEKWMAEEAEGSHRISVFTGPVFTDDDVSHTNYPGERPFFIPAGFWKIIALRHSGILKAAAFLVWQRDYDRENPVAYEPVLEQVRLTTIEYLTGFIFEDLRDADPLLHAVARRARARDAGAMRPLGVEPPLIDVPVPIRPVEVRSPADIVL